MSYDHHEPDEILTAATHGSKQTKQHVMERSASHAAVP